ncbi:MAG: hypothetical protein OXG36_02795 [Caldilineaceae bacterium]|nr:hypothetical protein [Caldilineaceae bacterium]
MIELQAAIERAKSALMETFHSEGYSNCGLEGWEDDDDSWIVLLSAEHIPPEGTAGHTLSLLTGGRRAYRKVSIGKSEGNVQAILPVPNPYAAMPSNHN